MRHQTWTLALAAALTLLAGCTTREFGYDDDPEGGAVAVSFDSYMQRNQATRAQQTGAMDDGTLRTTGFGVFAVHHLDATGTYAYDDVGASTGFNFMYNEHLQHNGSAWAYAPVKYWPNDNADADADEGTATGSLQHHYVSFFAYAPYTDHTAAPPADGITDMSANSTMSGSAALTYRTSATKSFDPETSVDLLWAEQTDLFKTRDTGEGYVSGTVRLPFRHALSKLQIAVKGFFDHTDGGTTLSPDPYGNNVDASTRILIESVTMDGSPLFTRGDMFLAPRGALQPYWQCSDAYAVTSFGYDSQDINAQLSNYNNGDGLSGSYWTEGNKRLNTEASHSLLSTDYATAAEALADVEALPQGVTNSETALTKDPDQYWLLVPTNGYVADGGTKRMTVNMVYYVITYDERLTMNTPRYVSIVKNDVSYTFDGAFTLEPGKHYKLLLQPGLTTVKFTLSVGEEWDSPIMLNPVVTDWYVTVGNTFEVE